MKISCVKAELLAGINIALRAVPSKTTLPILESFLIVADEIITITTNDKDMGIETAVSGNIMEQGKIAVDARVFSEIVRKLPDDEVVIESDNNQKIRITCEESVFNLNGKNPDEFPELPRTENEKKIIVSQFILRELIRQTIFSISQNDNNSMMRGELFEVEGNILKVVSLDSHRISIRKEEMANSYDHIKVIVPGKTLNEISKIINGDKDSIVEIAFDRNFVKFNLEGTMVLSRLIEGEFFNVEQMISSDYETEVTINKNDFLNSIDRAFTLAKEGEKKPIILEITENRLALGISTSLGSMNADLPITKTGKDMVIGFNPKFFIDALRVIDNEEVNIYFVNSTAPCFIRDNEGRYVYIILPVNINR